MAYITHVYDLYCEDRLIGQSKAAGQIANLMGIPIGAVTVYAKNGTLVDGRYKIVQKKEKAKSHLAYVLEEAGADYKFTYTICGVCDMEYRDPVNAPFAYCPYCGSKRVKRT